MKPGISGAGRGYHWIVIKQIVSKSQLPLDVRISLKGFLLKTHLPPGAANGMASVLSQLPDPTAMLLSVIHVLASPEKSLEMQKPRSRAPTPTASGKRCGHTGHLCGRVRVRVS